jgi:hypothetical protein
VEGDNAIRKIANVTDRSAERLSSVRLSGLFGLLHDGARCSEFHQWKARHGCLEREHKGTRAKENAPHLTEVAPKAATTALQKDLEPVANHPQEVSRLLPGVSSFLETDLAVEAKSGGVSSMLLNFVRKKLVKSFCRIGEEVKVKLTIRSYLPNPFTANALQILLVGFGRYKELLHNQKMVASKDAFSIMSVAGSTLVIFDKNVCKCMWTKKRAKTRCMDSILS